MGGAVEDGEIEPVVPSAPRAEPAARPAPCATEADDVERAAVPARAARLGGRKVARPPVRLEGPASEEEVKPAVLHL